MTEYTLIVDTREREPWDFNMYESCRGSLLYKLDEGDYTTDELLVLEEETGRKILRIERKATTNEIASNLGKYWKRFTNELKRLEEYEHKYLILEFTLANLLEFPRNSGIPRKLWRRVRMNGGFMQKRLEKIEEDYGVEVIFAGDTAGAMDTAEKIILEIHNANFKES